MDVADRRNRMLGRLLGASLFMSGVMVGILLVGSRRPSTWVGLAVMLLNSLTFWSLRRAQRPAG